MFPVLRIGGAASTGDGGANDGKRTNKPDTPTATAHSIRMRWVGWVHRYVPRTGRGSDRPIKGGCEPTEHGTKRRQRARGSKREQKNVENVETFGEPRPPTMPVPDRAAHQRQTGNNKHRREATVRQLDRTPRRSYTGTATAVSVRRLDRTAHPTYHGSHVSPKGDGRGFMGLQPAASAYTYYLIYGTLFRQDDCGIC